MKYKIEHNDEVQVVEDNNLAKAIEKTGWPGDECKVSIVADTAVANRNQAKKVTAQRKDGKAKSSPAATKKVVAEVAPPPPVVEGEAPEEVPEEPVESVAEEEAPAVEPEEQRPTGKVEFEVILDSGHVVKVGWEPQFANHLEYHGDSMSETGYRSDFGLDNRDYTLGEIKVIAKVRAEKIAGDLFSQQAKASKKKNAPEPVEEVAPVDENAPVEETEQFAEELDSVIEATSITDIVGQPTEAEAKAQENKQVIEQLAIEAEVMFLEMGRRLYEARENGEWTILHYETFKDYIEDLKLPMTNSYSWATRLMNVYEYLALKMHLDSKVLAAIGVAKLTRLLPAARKDELTAELIEAAKTMTDMDLREMLGHNVGGGEGSTEMVVICPRCGDQFDAKKATRP